MIKLSEFVNDYHTITERILINKKTQCQYDYNTYSLNDFCDFLDKHKFYDYIKDNIKSKNENNLIYVAAVQSENKNITHCSLYYKLADLQPESIHPIIDMNFKINKNIIKFNQSFLYTANNSNGYCIIIQLNDKDHYYVIICTPNKKLVDLFFNSFDNDTNDTNTSKYGKWKHINIDIE